MTGDRPFTWHVMDKALEQIVQECVQAGLDKEQTYRIWKIAADAFNRIYGEGGQS